MAMAMRLGPGPVFQLEMVRQGRRWQTYAARVLVVATLLATMAVCHSQRARPVGRPEVPLSSHKQMAAFASQLGEVLAIVELVLVLMLAPALSAGVLIPERRRGVLAHELTTDLSGMELAFGRWLGRVVPMVALIAAGAPFVFLLTFFGGVDPRHIVQLHLLLAGYALLIPAICLYLSLNLRRVTDLLAILYLLLAIWCGLSVIRYVLGAGVATRPAIDTILHLLVDWSPFYMLAQGRLPAIDPQPVLIQHLYFFIFAAGLSVILVLWTGFRLRLVCAKTADERPVGRRSFSIPWLRRLSPGEPSLDTRPVLWLEWARRRRTWATGLHAGVLIFGASIVSLSLILSWWEVSRGPGPTPALRIAVMSLGAILALSHLLALTAITGQWVEDRTNRQLELLGATPLEPREILRDRSAAAFGLLRYGVYGAPLLLLLGLPHEPFLVWVGMLLLGATAFGLSRFVASLSTWLGLRFANPNIGLGVGAGLMVALNVGVFLVGLSNAMTAGRNLPALGIPLLLLAGVLACFRYRDALWNEAKHWSKFTWAVVFLFAIPLCYFLMTFEQKSTIRSDSGIMMFCPFVAFVFCAISGLDSHFWNGHEFGPSMAAWTLFIAIGWCQVANILDRQSLYWLNVRMREKA